jgi:hypothetical protein
MLSPIRLRVTDLLNINCALTLPAQENGSQHSESNWSSLSVVSRSAVTPNVRSFLRFIGVFTRSEYLYSAHFCLKNLRPLINRCKALCSPPYPRAITQQVTTTSPVKAQGVFSTMIDSNGQPCNTGEVSHWASCIGTSQIGHILSHIIILLIFETVSLKPLKGY